MSLDRMNAKELGAYDGWTLWVDQYGNKWGSDSVATLKAKLGAAPSTRVVPMFMDRQGQSVQVGVIIKVDGAEFWLTAYRPFELPMPE